MAKLADILQVEQDRQDESHWNRIHLYKTGSFYSAYEWSAWLIAVITYNDSVRMQTKDRRPLAVTRIKMANTDQTFCRVGFPLKSLEKYIPSRLDFESDDDKHLAVTVALPSDGTAITYDRLAEAVVKWKEQTPIKQAKDIRDTDPGSDTDRQPTPGQPRPRLTSAVPASPGLNQASGLISQILTYPLASSTPAENTAFIQRMKQTVASIF